MGPLDMLFPLLEISSSGSSCADASHHPVAAQLSSPLSRCLVCHPTFQNHRLTDLFPCLWSVPTKAGAMSALFTVSQCLVERG